MQTTISASQVSSVSTRERFVRLVITADGIVCAVSGLLLLLLAPQIDAFLGLHMPLALMITGVILLVSAELAYLILRDTPLRWSRLRLLVGANVVWVVASLVLLTDGFNLSGGGKITILVQALVVADVAFFEWIGWRRSR
jgi:hypothetical protein